MISCKRVYGRQRCFHLAALSVSACVPNDSSDTLPFEVYVWVCSHVWYFVVGFQQLMADMAYIIMACSRRLTWAASTLLTRETRGGSWPATAVVIEFIDLPSAGRLTGK